MRNLWGELKRRNVTRVAATYAIVAWLLVQVINNIADPLRLPLWSETLVIVLLALGFPVALVLAWAYELTPAGIRPARPHKRQEHFSLPVSDTALIVLLLAVIGISAYQIYSKQAPEAEQTAVEEETSIAVLPFASLTTDPEQAYFGDGISEELLNALSRVPNLRVAGRTSSFRFRGDEVDIKQIGETLGVKYVLEGSARTANGRVRIIAQLINADTGFHVWSQTYDRKITDIFQIQEEISYTITEALKVSLRADRRALVPHRLGDIPSYEKYLMALHLYKARGSGNLEKALALLSEVTTNNPTYAPAWALMAQIYVVFPYYQENPTPLEWEQNLNLAELAAGKTLEIDPSYAGAFSALASTHAERRDWKNTEKFFVKALSIDPDHTPTHQHYAEWLLYTGYYEEALFHAKKAVELDPLAPISLNVLAWAYFANGHYLEGVQVSRKVLDVSPSLFYPVINLLVEYLVREEYQKALVLAKQRGNLNAEIAATVPFISALANGANQREATIALGKAKGKLDPTSYQYFEILLGSAFNDKNKMLEALERYAFQETHHGEPVLAAYYLVKIRKDPRYKELLVRSGLVDLWRDRGWPDFCRPIDSDDFVCS